jgi:hypothetical protein
MRRVKERQPLRERTAVGEWHGLFRDGYELRLWEFIRVVVLATDGVFD